MPHENLVFVSAVLGAMSLRLEPHKYTHPEEKCHKAVPHEECPSADRSHAYKQPYSRPNQPTKTLNLDSPTTLSPENPSNL